MILKPWLVGAGLCWMFLPTRTVPAKEDTTVEVTQEPQWPQASEPAPAEKSGVKPNGKDAPKPGEKPSGEAKPASGPAPASNLDQPFNLRLRALEERVNELKEKIFQSKARLIQLQEVVLHGTISGAKAVLVHKNEMGGSFRLARVQYALDGAPIFNRVDSGQGELDAQHEIEIFNGSIAPGNHMISAYLEYQGYGYGVFNYLRGYLFKIKSSYAFNAEEGKMTTVRIVGFEKGGFTTELRDRPTVRYDVETIQAPKPTSTDTVATNPSPEAPH